MTLTWYVCDLRSGDRRDELPLRIGGDVERTIGAASTLSASLPVRDPRCPSGWDQLLRPESTMLVLDNDGVPIVGYVIDKPVFGAPVVELSLRSLERALERVYCRTHDFYEDTHDEATAAQVLLSDILAAPLSLPGSWGFVLDVTLTGKKADHSYAFEEDRTVASALNDLMDAEGGPEWTVRLAWADANRSRIIKTIQVGPKIGSEIPGTVIENKHIEDRKRSVSASGEDLATHVIATSDGSGGSRPMSDAFVDGDALDRGVPQWEARVHATAVDSDEQLDRIADAGLRRRWAGLATVEMVLATTAPGCPRVGQDFDAGDTVMLDSDPVGEYVTDGGVTRYDDPASWKGMTRIIGWRASVSGSSFRTVTPVFWADKEVGVS